MEPLLLWGLGLLAASLLIVVIELFLPSAGVLALVATAVAIAGVVCLFRHDTAWGLAGTGVVLVGGPTFLFFGLRMMPHTPLGRMLVLSNDREDEREGDDEPAPKAVGLAGLSAMIGQEGVVVTDLRPVGTIRIGDKRFDALSELGMIRAGAAVRVTGVEGTELRVRAV